MRIFSALFALVLLATPAAAAMDGMISKASPHDVKTTIDRLEQAVTEAGAMIVARHDHAAAAQEAELELPPATVLIFGNPKAGTPLMQQAQTMGLDLPMRVLAYQNEDGSTQVLYHDPEALAQMHGIDPSSDSVQKVKGALDKLTQKATAEE